MSEGAEPLADEPRPSGLARGFHDLLPGLVPIGLALFAFWASWKLVGLPGAGSGTFLLLGFIPAPAHLAEIASAGTFLTLSAWALLVFGVVMIVRRHEIGNPQDYYGGLALVGLALIALWASGDLPGMRGFAFGPGTAPRMFAILLGVLGAGVAFNGLIFEGPEVGQYDILAPILISTAYVFFLFAQGTAAHVFTGAVALAGAAVAVIRLMGPRRALVRGPLFVTISVIFFAASVRPLGLVVSSFVTIMLCAAAAEEVRWRETLLVAIALTLFCSLLFPYGLNLPMPLWPWFWR